MKCQNGQLRNERDATICMMPVTEKKKLSWAECVPLFILGSLIVGLLVAYF